MHIHATLFPVDQHYPVVLHQSVLKKTLHSPEVLPIFCVSFTHSFQTEYEWICESGAIGVSSPVLKAGVYQCHHGRRRENTYLTKCFRFVNHVDSFSTTLIFLLYRRYK